MTPPVSVVIPTRNRAESVAAAVRSLEGQDLAKDAYEIIVVDNGSTDAAVTAALARDAAPRVRVLTETSMGASNARNAGWKAARADVVFFLDDDCLAAPDLLSSVVRAMEAGADAVGGRVVVRLPGPRPRWLSDDLLSYLSQVDWPVPPGPLPPAAWLASCNLAVRRSTLHRFGGFRADLGPIGNRWRVEEDVELLREIRRGGGRCWYDPRMIVHHVVTADRLRRRWFFHRAYWGGRSLARTTYAPDATARASTLDVVGDALRRGHWMTLACLALKTAGYAAGRLSTARP